MSPNEVHAYHKWTDVLNRLVNHVPPGIVLSVGVHLLSNALEHVARTCVSEDEATAENLALWMDLHKWLDKRLHALRKRA